MEDLQENKHQNDEGRRFAEIRSSVREIGYGWNTFNVLDQRYRQSQQTSTESLLDESSSESEISYTTANSPTDDDSYVTAVEDFDNLTILSEEFQSETSINSSIDRGRYKKNALITNLLQNAENDFHHVVTDFSAHECNTVNLINHNQNEKEEVDPNVEKKWTGNANEEEMYKDRVFRLFQSKEDDDIWVHPLKEQIQEDPVWRECRLSRKGIEVTETARSYYLNLQDEEFGFFEKKEGKKVSKSKKKVKKSKRKIRNVTVQ